MAIRTPENVYQTGESPSTLTGTVHDIPSGSNRTFTINAYDSDGALRYTGSSSANVSTGETVVVAISVVGSGAEQSPAPAVRVAGTPTLVRGYNSGYPTFYPTQNGNDARITGEIVNDGDVDATNVVIDVTLRDGSGNLVARVNNHSLGTIRAGDSAVFTVVVESIFASRDSPDPVIEVTFEE
jgi:hypothetical protein